MNLARSIIRQSIMILIVCSLISSIGGTGIELIQETLVMILPLFILIPAISDLNGDFGCIISSKFTTLLYLGKINPDDWWRCKELRILLGKILIIGIISAFYLSVLSMAVTKTYDLIIFFKVLFISLILVVLISIIIFLVSIIGGVIVYHKNQDPDNYLIPLTTSIADFASMVLLSVMVKVIF